MEDTKILYDYDELSTKSKILDIKDFENKKIIITERTTFHPVSNSWPDQPGDIGTFDINGNILKVIDSIIVLKDKDNNFYFDKEIPKKPEEDSIFLVGHIVENIDVSLIGEEVTINVDKEYRQKLSQSHSAVHLAALSLNKALKKYWTKDFREDSLGNPDFDMIAIEDSKNHTDKSSDRYRIGKSTKKKGFQREEFFENLKEVEKEINDILKEWVLTNSVIEISSDNNTLKSRRYWTCKLPIGDAKIPCGGTHVKSLEIYKEIKVTLTKLDEEFEFLMETFPVV